MARRVSRRSSVRSARPARRARVAARRPSRRVGGARSGRSAARSSTVRVVIQTAPSAAPAPQAVSYEALKRARF